MTALSAEQLAEVVRAVKEGLHEEMNSFKREMSEDREAADDRLLKKMKLEKVPTFKKKTHEKQYRFNEEVACKFEAARASLLETPAAVERAKTLLEEGTKLVCERQKLIRMADRSEHGWVTVEEYLEDELADNSDDEKRMQKAEYRAGRKVKAAAAKYSKKKAGSIMPKRPEQVSGIPKSFYAHPLSGASQLSLMGAVPVTPQHIVGYPKWSGAISAAAAASPPLQGPCFNCGKVGHVKKFCPLLQGASTSGK